LKKSPKTIVQSVNLAVLEEPLPFFNNEPVQIYMVNHFIYDKDIANLTMSSFGLPESNINELDSFDIDYDLIDEILEDSPIQDLQIEWAENVKHQDDHKCVRDVYESSLFGSDDESDPSVQPRQVSIMQPIYDRRRKKLAKCSVAFNLDDPCCSDDPKEKINLPKDKPVPPFQRLLNEDSSVSSEGLLNYFIDGRLQLFGHEHRNLVYERFCTAWKNYHKSDEDVDTEVQIANDSAISQPMDTDDSNASMFTTVASSVEETVVLFLPFPYGQKTMIRISAPKMVTPSPPAERPWTDLEIIPNTHHLSATATHTYEQYELDSDPDDATMHSSDKIHP
jgi:hypothetical protein